MSYNPPPGGNPGSYPPAPGGQGDFYIHQMGQPSGPYPFHYLAQLANAKHLKPDTAISQGHGPMFPASEVPGLFSDKEWLTAVLLSFFLGALGVDRFYLGHIGLGVAKLVTFGGCGVWALVDFILILLRNVTDAEGRQLR